VQEYLATPAPVPSAMFEHLYEALPSALEPQQTEVAIADEPEPESAAGSGAEQV
jgi:hypothetical protein